MAIKKNTPAAKPAAKPVVKPAAKPDPKAAPNKKAVATPASKVSTKPAAKPVQPKAAVKPVAKPAPVETKGKDDANRLGKKELAQGICDHVKAEGKAVPLSIAEMAIDAVVAQIGTTLQAGGEVVIPGFGKFVAYLKEAGTARNPATGEQMKTEAKYVPKFKPGAHLKELVNS